MPSPLPPNPLTGGPPVAPMLGAQPNAAPTVNDDRFRDWTMHVAESIRELHRTVEQSAGETEEFRREVKDRLGQLTRILTGDGEPEGSLVWRVREMEKHLATLATWKADIDRSESLKTKMIAGIVTAGIPLVGGMLWLGFKVMLKQ